MDASENHNIYISPGVVRQTGLELFRVLERVLPVRFIESTDTRALYTSEIVVEGERAQAEAEENPASTSLTIPRLQAFQSPERTTEIVALFAEDCDVPFPFRGRTVETRIFGPAGWLRCSDSEKVLATNERRPLWIVSAGDGPKRYRSGLALPVIDADQSLCDRLNGEHFLELLPLLHFLHEVCGTNTVQGPPLRACFMFDDPNLHWARYGFVDFRQIALGAAKGNYHVSFATIPLDAWYTHKATAEFFRRNSDHLSLLIHGNNHTQRELARNYTVQERRFLLNQAIRRIERLEKKTGIGVPRVMAAPHGACSEEVLEDLPRCGFEGATISHGSLRAHNRSKEWTRSLGYLPSELIQRCPALPRWRLSISAINTILLAAFLRQPIILVGHHQDLRNGIELLDHLARFINGLGEVQWGSMADLCRVNYQWRFQGKTLAIKPLGRKIMIDIPEEVSSLCIEAPSDYGNQNWRVSCTGGPVLDTIPGEAFSLPKCESCLVSLETTEGLSVAPGDHSGWQTSGALLRRLLTETRDRFLSSTQRPLPGKPAAVVTASLQSPQRTESTESTCQ